MDRAVRKFSVYELVLMAVMAALGIAVKPIVVPLAHIVCGSLMIPGGALAGGLYMMWLVIGYGMVKKPGAGFLIGLIQACLVIFSGVIGSHGAVSLITYAAPGLAIELVMLLIGHRCCCCGCCAIAGLAANVAGTACVNMVFFRSPGIYLVLVLSVAALSGLMGGILAWELIKMFQKYFVAGKEKKGKTKWRES